MKNVNPTIFLVLFCILGVILLVLILIATGVIKTPLTVSSQKGSPVSPKKVATGKIDDWEYEYVPQEVEYNSAPMTFSGGTMFDAAADVSQFSGSAKTSVPSSTSTIGFSTGGAKDVINFRENIEKGYFPLESDITYEGLFYDYYFDTGNVEKEDKMFYPSLTEAVSQDPISGEDNYYLTVGLNSNIKESDFARKKLNIVVVLDISGSMDSGLGNYYYDRNENPKKEFKTKMKLAEEAVNILIDQLGPEDSFGMALFDDAGFRAKPLNKVKDIDMEAIKGHILEVEAQGGTNFEAGYTIGQDLFKEYKDVDPNEYENRIIVITDAMPNIGVTDKEGLLKMMEDSSKEKIYTTFIGVGVDFNSEVVKAITDVRGANYYGIREEEEFKTRMGEEFEYMVTPLVFGLDMSLESDNFELEKIYGTDSLSSEKNNIMHVNTLFPSKSNDDGEVKGGVILLKLKPIDKEKLKDENGNKVSIKVSYETRSGEKGTSEKSSSFDLDKGTYYTNSGIEKAIVLSRYVNVLKDWITYERSKDDRYLIKVPIGIIDWFEEKEEPDDPYGYYSYYSVNERTSVELTASKEYKEIFKMFKDYLESEIDKIGDKEMQQEVKILDKILDARELSSSTNEINESDAEF